MYPTLVANAYFVITFLSIKVGIKLEVSLSSSLLFNYKRDFKIFVGVDGADINLELLTVEPF